MKYSINSKYYSFKNDGIYSNHLNRRLKGHKSVDGYVKLTLACEDGKSRTFYYHIVMWEHFNGDIPKGMQINHNDEDKENNNINNLSLMTPKDNCNYGNRTQKGIETKQGRYNRTVYQYDLDGKLVSKYSSTREVEKITGYPHTNISKACRNKFKQYKGYRWSYEPL